MVSVDILGPFPDTRTTMNRYIAVFCDHLTRWVEAVAFRRQTSEVVARMLVERICCRHGSPRILLSDRGAPFRILKVKKVHTAAYRPQTNGLVERFNRTLASMLSMYVDSQHQDWDRFLPYVVFAYNTTLHPATNESPFFMLYGREARLPVDVAMGMPVEEGHQEQEDYVMELVKGLKRVHEQGREALQRSQQQRENSKGAGRRVPKFSPGDQVMVRTPVIGVGLAKKLQHQWNGPFKVLRKMGETTYEVSNAGEGSRAISVNRLKPYYEYDHPADDPDDYAGHLEETGEAEAGEGNRTREPTSLERKQMQKDDPVPELETTSPPGSLSVAEPAILEVATPARTPAQQWRPQTEYPLPREESGVELTSSSYEPPLLHPAEAPSAPLLSEILNPQPTPAAPTSSNLSKRVRNGSGPIQMCKVCHLPRRGHKCKGRYRPIRQSTHNREKLGLASPDAQPKFGILDFADPEEPQLIGMYNRHDKRKLRWDKTVKTWEEEAKENGEEGIHIWNDNCEICDGSGKMDCCYYCNLTFHGRCLTKNFIPRGLKAHEELVCKDCLNNVQLQ
jgi:hypothetical protein